METTDLDPMLCAREGDKDDLRFLCNAKPSRVRELEQTG